MLRRPPSSTLFPSTTLFRSRVSDLLDRVGPQAGASWILWQAEDGFTESLPLEVARHPDTWIAYLMADQPLTPEHGYPARVLIPGRFGMKQPKWVRRMQLADHDDALLEKVVEDAVPIGAPQPEINRGPFQTAPTPPLPTTPRKPKSARSRRCRRRGSWGEASGPRCSP